MDEPSANYLHLIKNLNEASLDLSVFGIAMSAKGFVGILAVLLVLFLIHHLGPRAK